MGQKIKVLPYTYNIKTNSKNRGKPVGVRKMRVVKMTVAAVLVVLRVALVAETKTSRETFGADDWWGQFCLVDSITEDLKNQGYIANPSFDKNYDDVYTPGKITYIYEVTKGREIFGDVEFLKANNLLETLPKTAKVEKVAGVKQMWSPFFIEHITIVYTNGFGGYHTLELNKKIYAKSYKERSLEEVSVLFR